MSVPWAGRCRDSTAWNCTTETYAGERVATDLPAQLVCSARVKAKEAIASCHARARRGRRVSCPRSHRAAIRYDARSAKVHLAEGDATLATVSGRQRVVLCVPHCHISRIGLHVRFSELCLDRKGRLGFPVVVPAQEPVFKDGGEGVGVDLGVVRPTVT